jgi:hypothetical protein
MWFRLTASEFVSRKRDYFRKLLETSKFKLLLVKVLIFRWPLRCNFYWKWCSLL